VEEDGLQPEARPAPSLSLQERLCDLDKFPRQREFYDAVANWARNLRRTPNRPRLGEERSALPQALYFLSGPGGTGKSYVVETIRCMMDALFRRTRGPMQIAAPTGMTAVLVGGTTVHTLLSFPVNDKRGRIRNHRLTPLCVG